MENNNEKELMAELEGIMNSAHQDLVQKTEEEATHIFTELCKQFDAEIPYEVEAMLMGLTEVTDTDEIDEAKERARTKDKAVMSQFIDNLDDPEARAMKLQSIVSALNGEQMLDLLQDTETAMLLSAWLEPQGLVARVRRPDGLLQVMVTAGTVHFIKTLPTGDRIIKLWGHEKQENGKTKYPERDDFSNDYEYELCRGTYKYLAMPLELKDKSQEAYDTVLNAISEKLQRQVQKDIDED